MGLSQGKTDAEAAEIVRAALELGVNFIDTAEGYKTEVAVGLGIEAIPRDQVILSTKAGIGWQDRRCTALEMRERVEACLSRLRTDYVDVFHLHGVRIDDYEYAVSEMVPALINLQTAGKLRFLGITEAFATDPAHEMLVRAVQDDCWDVMMVGFNILNQSARERVFSITQEKGIGTLCMFAVRKALSRPEALRELMAQLVRQELVPPDASLDFLTQPSVADSIQEAAYRFCRWEPGIDVVLSGTGNPDHLSENAKSINAPQLPAEVKERLKEMFEKVDSVSGN